MMQAAQFFGTCTTHLVSTHGRTIHKPRSFQPKTAAKAAKRLLANYPAVLEKWDSLNNKK